MTGIENLTFLGILSLSFITYIILQIYHQDNQFIQRQIDEVKKIGEMQKSSDNNTQIVKHIVNQSPGQSLVQQDYSAIYNPLYPPVRRNQHFPPGAQQYFYQRTNGEYGPFVQVGYLSDPNRPTQVLPLMGRKIHSGQYEYYTISHFNPSVKIKIPHQQYELMSGENINVPQYGNLRAQLYDTNLTYNPYTF